MEDLVAGQPRRSRRRPVERTLVGFQMDFRVMDGSRQAGVLAHGDVQRGLDEAGGGRGR